MIRNGRKSKLKDLFQDETLTLSRRECLERIFEAALASATLPLLLRESAYGATAWEPASSNLYLQGGFVQRPIDYQPEEFVASARYSNCRAFRLNISRNSLQEIDSKVPIHSLEVHPIQPNLTIATSRYGETASLIDWSKGSEVKVLYLKNQLAFYGHGAFTADGKIFIATVARRRPNGRFANYSLVKIEVERFKILETIPFSFGPNHDLVAYGNNQFAIGGGSEGEISSGTIADLITFDATTGKFDKIASPTFPSFDDGQIGIRHILKKSPDLIVAGLTRISEAQQKEGGFVEYNVKTKTSKLVTSLQADAFHGELLSFDFARDGRMWVSLPESRKLIVWNERTKSVDSSISFDESVRSVRTIENLPYVIVGTDKQFYAFDPITLRRIEAIDSLWPASHRNGHICSHTRFVRT
ncbi:hypothetical protein BH10BDE1_BH10BDE1_08130 [soil metagenome]